MYRNLILCFVCFTLPTWPEEFQFYDFEGDPIDVVIPCAEKDSRSLDFCIAGIKANCSKIRRVIVVSSRRLTNQAEWFDEALYPFSKKAVASELVRGAQKDPSRVGWYYQQLLKFYAPFVIPEISTNVLVLDSDTVFLNPVEFLDVDFTGFYTAAFEYHLPYFIHASRLLPGLGRVYQNYSGVAHHMLFQTRVLEDLFSAVESVHKVPLWQAFCRCVGAEFLSGSGASEYEIYFNFLFSRCDQAQIRHLKWKNICNLNEILSLKAEGYHYVSCHHWEN